MKTNVFKKMNILIIIITITASTDFSGLTSTKTEERPIIYVERGYGLESYYNFLDPALVYGVFNLGLLQISSGGLVAYKPNEPNLLVGELANNWDISTNGTVYTFYLKQNIHYQDGSPFNAYTMKYSLDRTILINHRPGPAFYLQEYILGASVLPSINDINVTQANTFLQAQGIKAINDYTLQIKLTRPAGEFLSILTSFYKAISPYSIITHRPTSYTTNESDDMYGMISLITEFPGLQDWTKLGLTSNHNPAISGIVPQADLYNPSLNLWMMENIVGTGAYRLSKSTPEEISFIKNNDWYGNFNPNSPDTLTWIDDPDPDSRSSHFLQGESDILFLYDNDPVFNFIDSNGNSIIDGATAYSKSFLDSNQVAFNLNNKTLNSISPVQDIDSTWNLSHIINNKLVRYSTNDSLLASLENPFTALKFRKAFAYAFNYDYFIKEYFYNIFGTRSHGLIPPGMIGYQKNSIAKESIPIYNTTKAQELFKEVGWKGNITLTDGGNPRGGLHIVNNILANEINSLQDVSIQIINNSTNPFDETITPIINQIGWQADFNDPYGTIFPLLDSHGLYPFLNVNDPVIDDLINQSTLVTNITKRKELFSQIELITASNYLDIYLYNNKEVFLLSDRIQNIEESGSLDPTTILFRFPYLSIDKTPTTTTTTSTTTTSTITTATQTSIGFEFISVACLVFLFIIRKQNKKKF